MGKVLAILSQKGGSGKTTTSINLAHGLAMRDKSVVILDRDTQESSLDWGSMRHNKIVPVVDGKSEKIDLEIDKQRNTNDFVIVDGAPRVDSGTIKIIKKSDLIIVPLQASGLDVWASSGLVELIKLYHQSSGNKPKVRFLISLSRTNTRLSKSILPALEEYGFPVLKQHMTLLEIYKHSAQSGESVFSSMPNPASAEMNIIIDEILESL